MKKLRQRNLHHPFPDLPRLLETHGEKQTEEAGRMAAAGGTYSPSKSQMTPRFAMSLSQLAPKEMSQRPRDTGFEIYWNRNSQAGRDLLRRLVEFLPGRVIVVVFAAKCQPSS